MTHPLSKAEIDEFWAHEVHRHDDECVPVPLEAQWEELAEGTLE